MRQEIFGHASVRGAMHVKNGLPDQDACLVRKFKSGTLLVVSDGMGSHPHAEIGAQGVCRSVAKAVRLWQDSGCGDIRLLLPLIHSIWGLEVYPYPQSECGATCLFAFLKNDGPLSLGQLGDGAIFYSVGKDRALFRQKEDEFTNFTAGMSSIRSFQDWSLSTVDIGEKPVKLCLMTDGVSETLAAEKRWEFVHLLWKRISEKETTRERNYLVRRVLMDWPTIHTGDDRTVVSCEIR